jgi:hypothetical protein
VDALVEEVGRLRHAHHQARLTQSAVYHRTQHKLDNVIILNFSFF